MPTTADHSFCPYKGLQPYTEADRKYFFGRTRDEGIIISNLYASSVTVFYGASGVGKSSVLLAGAVPRLRQEPRDAVVVVFNTWQSEDFLAALKTEVAKQANLSAPIDTGLPLDEFLVETQRAVDLPLLMIFDQFEEYFLYHPPSPPAEAFESAFARVVNRRGTQVNFFLSLREDGLSKLDRFKSRIPTLMNNMLRLEHLDREAAKLAITQPLEEYNRESGQPPMTIEPSLVRAILNDLQGASAGAEQLGQGVARTSAEGSTAPIETPFLQMVLTRLWDEERAAGSMTLRMQTFEDLGRAANIARTHLDTMMARLTDAERDMAASILRYMVTPSGSKIAQEAAALASWTDLPKDQVEAILTRLSGPDMRILRTMQAPGQPLLYEIFHDVLAQAVLNWRQRYVAVQQEERIRREEHERAKKDREETERRLELERARRLRKVIVALSIIMLIMAAQMTYAFWKGRQAARAQKEVEDTRKLIEKEQNKLKVTREVAEHMRLGQLYAMSREFPKAFKEYDNVLALDSANQDAYMQKGYHQFRAANLEKDNAQLQAKYRSEAVLNLERSIQIDPNYVWGHYNLALAYWAVNKRAEAVKEVEAVLRLKPDFLKTIREDNQFRKFEDSDDYLKLIGKERPPRPAASPTPTPNPETSPGLG